MCYNLDIKNIGKTTLDVLCMPYKHQVYMCLEVLSKK